MKGFWRRLLTLTLMNGLFAFAGDHPTDFNVPAPVRVSQIGTWARGAEIDLPTMTTPAINSSTGRGEVAVEEICDGVGE